MTQRDLDNALWRLAEAAGEFLRGPHPEGLTKDLMYLDRAFQHLQGVQQVLNNEYQKGLK